VRDSIDMMRIRAESKGMPLILDLPSDFRRFINGDPTKLRQILINLLSNAIKFTDFGEVTLRLYAKDNDTSDLELYGEVQDRGNGIEPEYIDKIFQPFEKLANDDFKGTVGNTPDDAPYGNDTDGWSAGIQLEWWW